MDIAISSPTRLKIPGLPGITYRPKREINRKEESNNLPVIRETSFSQDSGVKVDLSTLNKNKIEKLNYSKSYYRTSNNPTQRCDY